MQLCHVSNQIAQHAIDSDETECFDCGSTNCELEDTQYYQAFICHTCGYEFYNEKD